MAGERITALQWSSQYVAIFKCHRPEKAQGLVAQELKVADATEIESAQNLQRVLGVLQRDLVEKRVYQYANNPTSRLLTFRTYSDGKENEGQSHLKALLQADDRETVQAQSVALAERYMGIRGVREGVLIFLISRGMLHKSLTRNCVFVFKCDFEDISQITAAELFRKIEDAIVEKTKKGALYPYFQDGQFDDNTIRVFDELGETQYWLEFLDLGERVSEYVPLQTATIEELPEETREKLAEEFERAPRIRSLADEGRMIGREERLPTAEVKALAEAVSAKAGDPKVTLHLGEISFTAPISQYGRTWILAEEEGERYILAKGSKLENRTRMLTPIDMARLPSLREAAGELDLALS
ncbi:MAG: DUF3900 domain-containing protein [Anaerolineae bacterium]|nr:DUF3900 domain-containing protein [Anaerolineae bacterium]